MEGGEILTPTPCPSFRELEVDDDGGGGDVHHESPSRISAVHRPDEEEEEGRIGDGGDSSDDDSEFSFVLRGPETGPGITADGIFSDGRIRPVYPVFGRHLLAGDAAMPPHPPPAPRSPLRKLLIEERNASLSSSSSSSSSLSSSDELYGIPPETYCLWAPGSAAPSPARCRKSGSTGSLMRWRVLSDLVVGRSHSDGREKFVFLAAEKKKKKPPPPPIPIPNPNPNPNPDPNPNPNPNRGKEEEERRAKGKGKNKGGKVTELDTVTARRVYYGKGSITAGRRTFLPYKPDLLGFFANVNGFTRTYHPF